MDSKELRKKIIELRGFPPPATHGVANYLCAMLAHIDIAPKDVLEVYGPVLAITDLAELRLAACSLMADLRSELSEKDWENYFHDLPLPSSHNTQA